MGTTTTTTKKKKKSKGRKETTDVGELLVKMYPHGSFIRPLFVHKQTQKDILERQRKAAENGNEEEQEEEEEEEEQDDEEDDEEDDDDDRPSSSSSFAAATVFVTGFPPDWLNEFTIRDLFSTSFGETKRVQLIRLETNSDANSALVTFEQTKSLRKLWKNIEEKKIIEAPITNATVDNSNVLPPQFGLDKFVYEHRVQRKGGSKAAKATIDEWFRNRAKEKEIEKRKRAREAEDDGWTVVQQKRGRRKTSDNQGITVGGVRASTVERRRKEALMTEEDEGGADADGENTTSSSFYRKKKKGTLGSTPVENFYKFQSRERRRNDLIALQRGFQADKAKVLAMKASRKFKPV